ncbi:MAG: hypothetical protein ACK5HP_01265 [Bacilli bacterium]
MEVELGKEQLDIITNTIHPSDIITHIGSRLVRYEIFVKNEYQDGALTKAELE